MFKTNRVYTCFLFINNFNQATKSWAWPHECGRIIPNVFQIQIFYKLKCRINTSVQLQFVIWENRSNNIYEFRYHGHPIWQKYNLAMCCYTFLFILICWTFQFIVILICRYKLFIYILCADSRTPGCISTIVVQHQWHFWRWSLLLFSLNYLFNVENHMLFTIMFYTITSVK